MEQGKLIIDGNLDYAIVTVGDDVKVVCSANFILDGVYHSEEEVLLMEVNFNKEDMLQANPYAIEAYEHLLGSKDALSVVIKMLQLVIKVGRRSKREKAAVRMCISEIRA